MRFLRDRTEPGREQRLERPAPSHAAAAAGRRQIL